MTSSRNKVVKTSPQPVQMYLQCGYCGEQRITNCPLRSPQVYHSLTLIINDDQFVFTIQSLRDDFPVSSSSPSNLPLRTIDPYLHTWTVRNACRNSYHRKRRTPRSADYFSRPGWCCHCYSCSVHCLPVSLVSCYCFAVAAAVAVAVASPAWPQPTTMWEAVGLVWSARRWLWR